MGRPLPSVTNSVIVFTTVLLLMIASRGTDAGGDDAANGSHGDEADDNDTHHEAHGVSVVHLQFEYVEQPLILTLFLVHVVLIKIGWFYD